MDSNFRLAHTAVNQKSNNYVEFIALSLNVTLL